MASKQRPDSDTRMKRKAYEKELGKLQVELCHLQEWVKDKGARIIILFEGRDAAGKGGTIKALTERVSPRVFRVVALPAPSDREKTQMFMQRYIEQFPAAGEIVDLRSQLVQPRRRRVRHGILHRRAASAFSGALPADRKIHRRWRHQADEDLAGSRKGGAGTAVCGPDRRSAAAVEAQPDGSRIRTGAGTTIPGRAT